MKTLADALPEQIARCRELIEIYESLGSVGTFGKIMIQRDIEEAEKAIRENDVVAQLKAFKKLEDCKLTP